jgi:hypothetical protein
MCVISMVMDHYEPRIPKIDPLPGWVVPMSPVPTLPPGVGSIEELRKLLADFHEAVAAAKRVDELTNQPDCVDPKKATLMERVADLERRLSRIEEAVGIKP